MYADILVILQKTKTLRMNIDSFRDMLAEDGISRTLGIEYINTPEPDQCVARMSVGENNTQPFGFLSGGASLALAETLAGVASCALCPGQICVGMTVHANHVSSAFRGDVVTATAHLLHKGMTTHVWNVMITRDDGQLTSTVNVTNYISPKKS